jgi:hypothetical protein
MQEQQQQAMQPLAALLTLMLMPRQCPRRRTSPAMLPLLS